MGFGFALNMWQTESIVKEEICNFNHNTPSPLVKN